MPFPRSLDDERGGLWFSCNRGIFRVSKDQLNAFADRRIQQVSSQTYGTADGMRSAECNGGFQPAGWRLADGALAFPTMKGLAVVRPGRLMTNSQAPPVLIERVVVDNRAYDLNRSMQPPPAKDSSSFNTPH